MDYKKAIWAIAHRLCRMLWMILHNGVRYKELGHDLDDRLQRRRTAGLIRRLRKLGYDVTLKIPNPAVSH